jgi:hypothetical protein
VKQCGSNAIAEHRAHAHVRDAPLTHRHGARYLVWQEGASPLAELPNCQWRRSRWAANEQKQRKHGGCAAESLWNGTSTEGPGRDPVTNEQKQTWPINGNHECEDPDSPAYLSRPRVESAHLVLPNAPRCLAARHHVQTPRLSAGDRAPLGSYSNLFANKKLGSLATLLSPLLQYSVPCPGIFLQVGDGLMITRAHETRRCWRWQGGGLYRTCMNSTPVPQCLTRAPAMHTVHTLPLTTVPGSEERRA